MSLPEFSVKRKVTVTMLMMIVVLGGVVAFFGLGLDLMPKMEYPMITVVTSYEGVAPEDIEKTVTKPVEDAVGTVEGIKNVYSTSLEGVSIVILEFEWGTNLDFAAQDVRDNLDMIRALMPTDAKEPLVLKFDISQMPVVFYGVTGMKNTMELRKYLDDNIKPRLERLKGVAAATLVGGETREIDVLVSSEKLAAYGISPAEVSAAITSDNVNVSAGNLKGNHIEYFIRTIGEYKTLEDIENTPIKETKGVTVYVKDVAKVVDTFKERRDITRLDNKDAVLMMISKQSGANTVKAIDRVKKKLRELKKIMPESIHYYPVFDQSHIIKKILSKTLSNVIVGGILAVLFLYAFVRNIRPVIAISLAIPISIITTFIGLYLMNYTFNIFTLAGFALVVGMLVDNAVVVIENIFRHLENGEKRPVAASSGADEVSMAITTSTLTTIAVFLPMVLSKGLAGQLARPMALTITVGLVSSLFVALTIVPMVAAVLFSERGEKGAKIFEKGFINRLKGAYRKILALALRKRKIVLGSAVILFIASLLLLKVTGFEFMPEVDKPIIMFQFSMPVGTNLDETKRLAEYIDKKFMALPEKKAVFLQVGRSAYGAVDAAMGTGPADVNEAMIMARLTDLENRKRRVSQITDSIRKQLPALKNVSYTFKDIGQAMMGSGVQSPVEIKIFGKDLGILKKLADEISAKIKNVEGIRDVDISLKKGKPEYRIKIDRDKAAHYFLNSVAVGNTIRDAVTGRVISKFRTGGDETDIRLRSRALDRKTLEDIENTSIKTPMGFNVTLKDVSRITKGVGPLKIERENRLRKIVVSANVVGRPIGKVAADIKKEISRVSFPLGYFVELGGTYKQMKDTMRDLILALLAAVILIYMIMAAQFESLTQPFVIMFSVPMGIIGVMVGLAIMGMSFSVPAMMGVVILAGIVVNNGIVMIDFVNQMRARGVAKYDALIEGAVLRLRPILITSLTTIFGILPMAFSHSQGAEMRAPLGVAVSFGLMFSMVLTLVVIPVLYASVDKISARATEKITKKLHNQERGSRN